MAAVRNIGQMSYDGIDLSGRPVCRQHGAWGRCLPNNIRARHAQEPSILFTMILGRDLLHFRVAREIACAAMIFAAQPPIS